MSCWYALPADIYSDPFSFFVVAAVATVATCPGDVWSPQSQCNMALSENRACPNPVVHHFPKMPIGGVAHFQTYTRTHFFSVSIWDL